MKQHRIRQTRHFISTDFNRLNDMYAIELFLTQNKENNKEEK